MKLINGDAIKTIDMMIEKGIKVDAIITDIPYGITQNKIDVFPKKEFFEKIWKITNTFITTVQGKAMLKTLNSLPKSVKWHDLVWDKMIAGAFLNANRQHLRQHENILVMYKKQPTYNPQMWESGKKIHSRGNIAIGNETKNQNYGKFVLTERSRVGKTDRFPTSILKFKKDHNSVMHHATQKPVALYEYLIKTFTKENEVVFDPFMGGGTTGIAAKKLKRKFIGVELNKEYYEISKKRISEIKNEN